MSSRCSSSGLSGARGDTDASPSDASNRRDKRRWRGVIKRMTKKKIKENKDKLFSIRRLGTKKG